MAVRLGPYGALAAHPKEQPLRRTWSKSAPPSVQQQPQALQSGKLRPQPRAEPLRRSLMPLSMELPNFGLPPVPDANSKAKGRRFTPEEMCGFGRRSRPPSAARQKPAEHRSGSCSVEPDGRRGSISSDARSDSESRGSRRLPRRRLPTPSFSEASTADPRASTRCSSVTTGSAAGSGVPSTTHSATHSGKRTPAPEEQEPWEKVDLPSFEPAQLQKVLDCLIPLGGQPWSEPPPAPQLLGAKEAEAAEAEALWRQLGCLDGSPEQAPAQCAGPRRGGPLKPLRPSASQPSLGPQAPASGGTLQLAASASEPSLPPLLDACSTPPRKAAMFGAPTASPDVERGRDSVDKRGGLGGCDLAASRSSLFGSCDRFQGASPGRTGFEPRAGFKGASPYRRSKNAPRGMPPQSREQVLTQFRHSLLKRYRSLHEAFAKLDSSVSSKRGLSQQEFRGALALLSVSGRESDAVFMAVDARKAGSLALMDVRDTLTGGSREAVLWELRCCLEAVGVNPQDPATAHRKAASLARDCRMSTLERACQQVKQLKSARRTRSMSELSLSVHGRGKKLPQQEKAAEDDAPDLNVKLNLSEWLKFCVSIGLSSLEAGQIFTVLGGDVEGFVDLPGMFSTLRAAVAPEVSLEGFTARLVLRYGSVEAAFGVFASSPGPWMRALDFRALSEALDVNDKDSHRLWEVLMSSRDGLTTKAEAGILGLGEPGVTLSSFVSQLQIWGADTSLGALRQQFLERFGDLHRARRCLVRAGLTRKEVLQAGTLATKLEDIGIPSVDAERIIETCLSFHGGHVAGGVTLDSLFEALRETRRGPGCGPYLHARAAVREGTQALWQQLHAVQEELKKGSRGNSPAHCAAALSPPGSPGSPGCGGAGAPGVFSWPAREEEDEEYAGMGSEAGGVLQDSESEDEMPARAGWGCLPRPKPAAILIPCGTGQSTRSQTPSAETVLAAEMMRNLNKSQACSTEASSKAISRSSQSQVSSQARSTNASESGTRGRRSNPLTPLYRAVAAAIRSVPTRGLRRTNTRPSSAEKDAARPTRKDKVRPEVHVAATLREAAAIAAAAHKSRMPARTWHTWEV